MAMVNGKTLIGWGVFRESPWDFVGLFETQLEAAALAIDKGNGYNAHYGEMTGEQSFVWTRNTSCFSAARHTAT